MNATLEVFPFDEADLEACREFGLDEARTRQVVIVGAQTGVAVATILNIISTIASSAGVAVVDVGEPLGRVEIPPNLRAILAPREPTKSPALEEHRSRSMHKPTGMPWDRRRR